MVVAILPVRSRRYITVLPHRISTQAPYLPCPPCILFVAGVGDGAFCQCCRHCRGPWRTGASAAHDYADGQRHSAGEYSDAFCRRGFHNTYSQFDVGNQGVILNNAHNNVQTQLGGMVAGNPWLAKGEARIILNEVNSRNPSQLNGFVEVAGKKARVVIANRPASVATGAVLLMRTGPR